MKVLTTTALLCTTPIALGACSYTARDADRYRDDVSALLDARTSAITQCCEDHIGGHPPMVGSLVLDVTVSPYTGKVEHVTVLEPETTVSEAMASCVQLALRGLVLSPPDWREGHGTFRWVFQTQSA